MRPVQQSSSDPIVQSSWHTTATGTFNVPPRTTAVFVNAALGASAELRLLWGNDERAWFRVHYSCTPPTATAEADINGIPVWNGQRVKLIIDDDGLRWFRRWGRLWIWDDAFELTVTCTDAAGDTAMATALPEFPGN